MIQTVFHEPSPSPAAQPKKPRRHKITRLIPATAPVPHLAVPQPRAFVILTDWTNGQLSSRMRLVVSGDSQHSYAALPTPNGWLIVQL
jgi:hypothetical protein